MADASSRASTPVEDSYSSMPSTPVENSYSSMPSTHVEDSSMPSTPMEYSSRPSTPVEGSSRSSTPEEDYSKPPALPDQLMRKCAEYHDRKTQGAPKSDYMEISEILEELEEDDALYVVGLVQMYKGPNTKIENDLYETGEFVFDISTLPDSTYTLIWKYLSRRGLID
ncbi:hypothetical protein N5P37_010436 [Trichoderma harzianum]|uniref:NET domain-containing protein n=1 Tax=Trichoderma harzianum CBS 226.95 TaxID=983964 RepID=A0A2T4A0G9_TRIHA|nr:hypothetical protein M431DRAFT_541325 [Trichoderma harzianum CBS 226.95]KAK0756915.1 hypothetical protein N5P37_010436 [Trichoderma harzianum]PKK47686.1 hypothetical protein CI102_6234 [Trichoderma harzianum]PTB50483.1 hypothetical protein M431DRAFT_541325 [Trichoderma harzianum CBS 226.95]